MFQTKEKLTDIGMNDEYIFLTCSCGYVHKISIERLKEKGQGQFICENCKRVIQYTVFQNGPLEVIYDFYIEGSKNPNDAEETIL